MGGAFLRTIKKGSPEDTPAIMPSESRYQLTVRNLVNKKIRKAIFKQKSVEAAQSHHITAEALNVDVESPVEMLHRLLEEIWETEIIPQEWKGSVIVKLPKQFEVKKVPF